MTQPMAPTSENTHQTAMLLHEDPYEIFLSTTDMDNSCETYFYCDCSPSTKSAIPEASPAFRRALGAMDDDGRCILYQPQSDDSDDNDDDDDHIPRITRQSPKRLPSSSTSSSSDSSSSPCSSMSTSPATSPSTSPRVSPQLPQRSTTRHINIRSSRFPRKATSTSSKPSSGKFLSVPPSSSLPKDFPTPCKTADSSDSGAHKTLAGLALRKGCSRKAASFGGYDTITVDGHRFEKRVSWADERGSKHQLIHVRLIRPRLTMSTSDGRSSTPGQSILKTPDS